jgi:NTP pyrophosphatase (non-canonical NTP hydrolase)
MNKELHREYDSSFFKEKNVSETNTTDSTTHVRIVGTDDSFSKPIPGGNILYTKNVTTVKDSILGWAEERGLIGADPVRQMLKLIEEVGELGSGMARNNRDVIADSIGDIVVVLTILAKQLGMDIEQCTEDAYAEIANRKGKMVNGVFVKLEDLIKQDEIHAEDLNRATTQSVSGKPDSTISVKI